jgi:WhiB family transcriptional regulator, redox-sensing transcriptional regulator
MTSTLPNVPLVDDEHAGRVTAVDLLVNAACRDEDPELFFPVGKTGPALLQIEDAKEVCRRCDVVDACLQWALETGQDAGVWGGMSEDERRSVRKAARSKRETARSKRETAQSKRNPARSRESAA